MADRMELLLEAERRGILPADKQEMLTEARTRGLVAPLPVQQPRTLQETAAETLPFEDLAARGTILPIGRTQGGEVVPAFPQVLKDVAESALLPGHVARGLVTGGEEPPGTFTPEDVTRFALDVAAPMTAGRGVGAARSALPSPKAFVAGAPTDEALKQQARNTLSRATGSGVRVEPDSFQGLLAVMSNIGGLNKLNPTLHPRTNAALGILQQDAGRALDVEDLMVARRILGQAQKGVTPEGLDERRIAGLMEDALDRYIENLSPADLVSGSARNLGPDLRRFRSVWSRLKKSEIIEDIIEKADIQASGFENGIRTGFRSLLNNKKRIRGFTPDERRIMRRIVKGGKGQNTLRLLGKLSFGRGTGTNFLGGSIGTGGGAAIGGAVGGPVGVAVGGAIPPLVGAAAQRGADAGALGSAQLARALAATGGNIPRSRTVDNLLRAVVESGGPIVGATPQEQRPTLTEAQLRNMF